MMSGIVVVVIVECCHPIGKQKEQQDYDGYLFFVSHAKEVSIRHSSYY
jgi:hypothetical protein